MLKHYSTRYTISMIISLMLFFLCSVWTGSLLLGLQVKDLCTMAFPPVDKTVSREQKTHSSAVDLAELIIIPSESDGVMSLQ